MTKIAIAPDFGVASVIKSLLESEGIVVFEITTSGNIAVAGAEQGFNVEVLARDRARARDLLIDNSFGNYLVE